MFDGNIPYTFHAYLAHKDGTRYDESTDAAQLASLGNKSITISIDSDNPIVLNGSSIYGYNSLHVLSKTGDHENVWTVTYDSDIELGSDYCLLLIAEPDGSTNLSSLSATIIVDSYPIPNPVGWSCELAESGAAADPVCAAGDFAFRTVPAAEQTEKESGGEPESI